MKKILLAALLATSFGATAADRNFNFMVTGDPQFDNGALSRNAESARTLADMGAQMYINNLNRGIIITGDLTQNTRPNDEYEFYLDAISNFKHFVFDGQGNHDEHDGSWVQTSGCAFDASYCVDEDAIIEEIRGRWRNVPINWHTEGGVYSWDWDDIHFVQLGSFAGNTAHSAGWAGHVDPYTSLNFLKADLAAQVGNSGRPVVLSQHYEFEDDIGSGGAWSDGQAAELWDAIAGYNVVAIMGGHVHHGQGGEGWSRNWTRPVGKMNGPDSIPNIVAGAALNGVYLNIEVRNDQMTVKRYAVDGSGNSSLEFHQVNIDISTKVPQTSSLANMQAGKTYQFAMRSNALFCDLQFAGGSGNLNNGERDAKFDCGRSGDAMYFKPTTSLVDNAITGEFFTVDGRGERCNLQWNGSLVGGERNAKFDCEGGVDPMTIKAQPNNSTANITVTSDNNCGLQWGSDIGNNERHAKFDCAPAFDSFKLYDMVKLGESALGGNWVSSGGRDANNANNPHYTLTVFDAASVEINLTSSIDTYLYLKDSAGNVIASDDDGGSGYNSKIVKTLAAGSYTVIAATYSSGRNGGFGLNTSNGVLSLKRSWTPWASGQPHANNIVYNCAYHAPDGLFRNSNCEDDGNYACKTSTGLNWAISTVHGTENSVATGQSACQALGSQWIFAVPATAQENDKLKAAKSAAGDGYIWLNFRDEGKEGLWR